MKRKRYPLTFRATRELRQQIEMEAANSGRSLIQEVEALLELGLMLRQLVAEDRLRYMRELQQRGEILRGESRHAANARKESEGDQQKH